ncbi:YihY/virulence factor BrkB family protein [Spirochaeta lutea]|uniref:Uncharacterized protein n=1 Tax=Spirochaeta lutea TaxID=1480694 RepID=A0A098R1P9_9SPIO|nr:YhjD/YihY/BrkB family envelope integrity protein [Spirochaeta lutea]KGE73884.1 hypothetical protein DC28_01390 [Spirochaeta lutea]
MAFREERKEIPDKGSKRVQRLLMDRKPKVHRRRTGFRRLAKARELTSTMRLLRFFRIYDANNGPILAKGIAFSLLFGSIPLLFILVSLRSVLLVPEVMTLIENQLLGFLPPDIKQQVIDRVLGEAPSLSSLDFVTIGAFLYAVNTLFTDLGTGMATMLGSSMQQTLVYRVVAIPLMAVFLLLFYAGAVLTPLLDVASSLVVLPGWVSGLLSRLAAWMLYTVIIAGMYYLFSGRILRFIPTLVIAGLAAGASQAFAVLGSRIILGLGARLLILGAVASVLVVLFYMRILSDILLISSVLVRIYAVPQGIAETESKGEPWWHPKAFWRYLTAGLRKTSQD